MTGRERRLARLERVERAASRIVDALENLERRVRSRQWVEQHAELIARLRREAGEEGDGNDARRHLVLEGLFRDLSRLVSEHPVRDDPTLWRESLWATFAAAAGSQECRIGSATAPSCAQAVLEAGRSIEQEARRVELGYRLAESAAAEDAANPPHVDAADVRGAAVEQAVSAFLDARPEQERGESYWNTIRDRLRQEIARTDAAQATIDAERPTEAVHTEGWLRVRDVEDITGEPSYRISKACDRGPEKGGLRSVGKGRSRRIDPKSIAPWVQRIQSQRQPTSEEDVRRAAARERGRRRKEGFP